MSDKVLTMAEAAAQIKNTHLLTDNEHFLRTSQDMGLIPRRQAEDGSEGMLQQDLDRFLNLDYEALADSIKQIKRIINPEYVDQTLPFKQAFAEGAFIMIELHGRVCKAEQSGHDAE